jgi:probable F420-dependent oxidoreductase
MRFHQAVAFMETDQLLDLCRATDASGYAGIYLSDHLFFPKTLRSRYTYSPHEDGSPIWAPETDWPDCWCVISAMAAVTEHLHFTTGVYIAPARDLFTVAKAVGTTAVLAPGRVHLGVGVGWCKEEFDATGQVFQNRGRRLDDMIPALRALWSGGWVEHHGPHYDFGPLQMNPSPPQPIPILCGGHSGPALRRSARLCDGWIAAQPYREDEARHYLALMKEHLAREGRADDDFTVYMALNVAPDVDVYRRFEDAGVTDLICAPWMFAARRDAKDYRSPLEAKLRATEDFATRIIAKM